MPNKPPADASTPGPPPALWPATWITHPSARNDLSGVTHFRRAFDLPVIPSAFRVRVTADSRYELFVNGARVGRGPARCDAAHWRYDTYDLAPYLKPGRNVVAAVTWFLAPEIAPWAQMGVQPGFLMCGEEGDAAARVVNTPDGWKAFRNTAWSFVPNNGPFTPYYSVIGWCDRVEGAAHPWGWEQPDFDASRWDNPTRMANGTPRGARDGPGPWQLVPNPIPPMEFSFQPITLVVRSEGATVANHRLALNAPVTVPPNARAVLLLDNSVLTTGYPELTLEGGRGAIVRTRYSEALFGGRDKNEKGNRNDTQGRACRGHADEWLPDGPTRIFRPLWWRTFRYLQIEVETKGEPLTLHGLTNVYTGYPFRERAKFVSPEPSLAKIWEVGWRTARLCAHETYMDCPYYEQLQYGGDTRIQCLVSYYVSGDPRLARNAIAQLDQSRIPDGITQSRYPCWNTQIIPPFALWWVGMIHDHWMFVGEADTPAFVRAMLPGARSVMEWFLQHQREDGLLGPLPWWNFVDWAREFPDGVPPGVGEGGSSILSLQLVLALREAAEMEAALGLPENARRYREAAQRTARAVMKACWSAEKGLLADTPARDRFSEHANALGILADLFSPPQTRQVASRLTAALNTIDKPSLAAATFYFRFYLHRALRKAGRGDEYLNWLEPWREMLRMGLTTWAENPEPTRSDCHAWSAHPNADLLATVLGVEPAAPGFSRVSVSPHLGALTFAEGNVPHPKGDITVKLRRDGGRLTAEITLPPDVPGVFRHKGREQSLRPGRQILQG